MIRKGYRYKAFNVKHLVSNKGKPFTQFSIGDSIKNNDGTYSNNGWYNVTVFDGLQNLADGMQVRINDIQQIEKYTSQNGKEYMQLVVVAEVDGANSQSFASQQSQFQAQPQMQQMQQSQQAQIYSNMQSVELDKTFDNSNNTFDIMEDEIAF